MNTFFSQLKKEARHIKLTVDERKGVRTALERAMHASALQRKEAAPVESPIRVFPSPFFVFMPRLMAPLAFVLILVTALGSTAYAAEGALPGDLLYPVKVRVNERIAVALTRTPEANAETHVRLAERRLEEAEELTARGSMTAETTSELEERFEAHARTVEAVVQTLEERDAIAAADISARLESSIEAHSQILARLSQDNEDEESREESSKFARALRERGERAAAAPRPETLAMMESPTMSSDEAEEDADALAQTAERAAFAPAAKAFADSSAIRFAENASTTLREIEAHFLQIKAQLKVSTSDDTNAQIERLRERIRTLLLDANVSSRENDAQKVFKDAIRLKTFLEAQKKFRNQILLPAPDDEESEDGEMKGDIDEMENNEEKTDEVPRDEEEDDEKELKIDATHSLDRVLPL